MATYAWTIDLLSTKDITKDGTTYTDVILRVNATLTGTSETIGSITANAGFDLDMNVSNIGSEFTAYGSITKANVISWVENKMDADILANIKSEIEKDIAFQEKVNGSAPKGTTDSEGVFTPSFPWS